jgi:phage repressor protein C with HTH and peptisase S24 domain
MRIREVDVQLGASPDGEVHPNTTMQNGHEKTVAEWQIPAPVIRIYTDTPSDEIVIARIKGDSMKPEFQPGDRVLVDTLDRLPSPSGVFAIWDGFAQIVKRIELVPYSDPPRALLISANRSYEPREVPLSDLIINGRVIGRWDRT